MNLFNQFYNKDQSMEFETTYTIGDYFHLHKGKALKLFIIYIAKFYTYMISYMSEIISHLNDFTRMLIFRYRNKETQAKRIAFRMKWGEADN